MRRPYVIQYWAAFELSTSQVLEGYPAVLHVLALAHTGTAVAQHGTNAGTTRALKAGLAMHRSKRAHWGGGLWIPAPQRNAGIASGLLITPRPSPPQGLLTVPVDLLFLSGHIRILLFLNKQ